MRKKIDFNNKIATRESFGKALVEIEDEDIVVLDADLSSSTKTDMFKEKYPNRFFELGISEADMIGTAAGMATCGKKPFVATFAAFATGRVYDQIRCSIAYPNLNVKIVGTHAGITVGEDGATHQMLEDINLMRTMPNMLVISPSDDIQAKILIKKLAEYEGPAYVRLSRMKTPVIYEGLTEDNFEIGKGIQIGKGTDATIFATGDLLSEALKAQKLLKKANYDVRVVDIHTIKPIDEELIIKCAQETNKLYSLENHSITGGLGTAIAEVLCDKYPHQLTRFGMENEFGRSGTPADLLKYYKLDAESIVNKILLEK
ncbi:MAG: transketolase family protein [Clostridiales bacterium]|nr:transketolase family protein [Clostridiales bacterium]